MTTIKTKKVGQNGTQFKNFSYLCKKIARAGCTALAAKKLKQIRLW
jgi:hypothetical protein